MKISSLKLLILFCAVVSSAQTHAQLGTFHRFNIRLDKHPAHTISNALKELHERRPSDFRRVFDGLNRGDRANLIPLLKNDGLLNAVPVDNQLLLMLMPVGENQALLFDSLKSLLPLPDSINDLTEKMVISEYFKRTPYLIDVAMRIYGERGPIGRVKMISLLEYLHDMGEVSQMYYDVPRAWRILFSCYDSFSERLIHTPIEYLFTDEFIERLLAKAIAEHASQLSPDYRSQFLFDIEAADDVFVDTIFNMVQGSISWMEQQPMIGPQNRE